MLLLASATIAAACDSECVGLDCGGGGGPPAIILQFSMVGDATGAQDFIATTDDFSIDRLAVAELGLPFEERTLFITGPIERGNGDGNLGWNWHFPRSEWDLTDVENPQCDGNAVLVEQAIDYWVDTVGQFCPAGARIVAISYIAI